MDEARIKMLREQNCSHANVRRYLHEKYIVHAYIEDYKRDSGDEGGFVLAVSEDRYVANKFYFQWIYVSCNSDICRYDLDPYDLIEYKEKTGLDSAPYFLEFDCVVDATNALIDFFNSMTEFLNMDEDEEMPVDMIPEPMHESLEGLIDAFFFAYVEYPYETYRKVYEAVEYLDSHSYYRNQYSVDFTNTKLNKLVVPN